MITAIKGMNDILPAVSPLWQYAEECFRSTLLTYGYAEIRTPVLEPLALFSHAIGTGTDIVDKEMYHFTDKSGEEVALRPEGTASVVRALTEHSLLRTLPQKIWYMGSMFRYERPQKGRYRQFHQWGAEAFGLAGPDIDAELLLLAARLWRRFGLSERLTLELNSLGSLEERLNYRAALVTYLEQHQSHLDTDSQRRLHTNPLRILDSKSPEMQSIIQEAPILLNFLGDESRRHFEQLCDILNRHNIAFKINPRLVRGLDYYNNTVFEWTTTDLGTQGAVCAGGHYDNLVMQHAKSSCPAVGFAIGVERLLLLLELNGIPEQVFPPPHAYLVLLGEQAQQQGLLLAEKLRDHCPRLRLITHCGVDNAKTQFKRADRSQALYAFILGEDELANNIVTVKPLRNNQEPQQQLMFNELVNFIATL